MLKNQDSYDMIDFSHARKILTPEKYCALSFKFNLIDIIIGDLIGFAGSQKAIGIFLYA